MDTLACELSAAAVRNVSNLAIFQHNTRLGHISWSNNPGNPGRIYWESLFFLFDFDTP